MRKHPTASASLLQALCCILLLQTACLRRTPNQPPTARAAFSTEYVDLRPDWTVQVVIPILRSGGYLVPSVVRSAAKDGEVKTGDDFLGYERDYYAVRPRRGDGIQLRFSYAEVWEKGKTHKRQSARINLFEEAARFRHLRLVYLTRLSEADHNMAIVASDEPAALDELTRLVTRKAECRSSQQGSCRWVPEGIAVTPERNR